MLPLAMPAAARADDPAWLQVDLPQPLRMRNAGGLGPGGPGTGAGLCVFTSVEMAARWQGEYRLLGFQEKMKREPGGGWPEKLTKMLARYAPGVDCLQATGCDLAFLRPALASGYLPGVTWQGNHMLSLVGLTATSAAVLDNNSPDKVQVMRRSEFYARAARGGGLWAALVLGRGPPAPIPVNARGGAGIVSPLPLHPGCLWHGQPGKGPRFTLNGKEISRAEAEALVKKGGLPRLTCVGDTATCKRFDADVVASPGLAAFRDKLVIQSYAADHPLAAGVGLVPGVYLQAAPGADGKGKVLWRLRAYRDAAQVAAALRITETLRPEALRRKDPGYDPAKDRDPEQAPPPVEPDATPDTQPPASDDPMTPALLGALGGAAPMLLGLLVMFLTRRTGASPAPAAAPTALPPTVLPVAQPAAHPLLGVLFAGHPVAQSLAALVIDELKAFATARMQSAAGDLAKGLLGGLSPAAPAPAPAKPAP